MYLFGREAPARFYILHQRAKIVTLQKGKKKCVHIYIYLKVGQISETTFLWLWVSQLRDHKTDFIYIYTFFFDVQGNKGSPFSQRPVSHSYLYIWFNFNLWNTCSLTESYLCLSNSSLTSSPISVNEAHSDILVKPFFLIHFVAWWRDSLALSPLTRCS